MFRYPLLALAVLCLFSNFTCPEECEFFDFGTLPLEVTLENPAGTYAPGATIWINATFPATQTINGTAFTIGAGGGLVVSQLFHFDSTVSELTAALADFTPMEDVGMVVPNGPEDDPSAAITRFTCTGGTCAFRTGFRADSTGTYLLRVEGSALDLEEEAFRFCNDPSFGTTTLAGGNNLTATAGTFPLFYAESRSFFFDGIDPGTQQNIFLIRVE